jgi:N-acetylglutamate synthase-like GNAT family acetyltransferase
VTDIAEKLVCTAGQRILKVTEATARRLGIEELFEQAADPPRFRGT